MKGRSSPECGPGPLSKWTTIHRVLREKKISILCLQETHLTEAHSRHIESLFGRHLYVLNSAHPDNPGSTAGVAFVINKELVNTHSITTTELIPGRALALTLNWHNEQTLTILNVYAPNSLHAHAHFWTELQNKIDTHPHRPDLLLGDFNLIEDPIDRAPAHEDYEPAVYCLRDFRNTVDVQDIWRQENPTTRLYTYTSPTQSLSRLDHIYARPRLTKSLYDWDATTTPIPSDHKMILVRFVPPQLPYVGKGRWTWPLGLIHDKSLTEAISSSGILLQRSLENPEHTPTLNVQQSWVTFKNEITNLAKQSAKSQMTKMSCRINALKRDLKATEQHPQIDHQESIRTHVAALEGELKHLQNKCYKNASARAQAQWHNKGERISKYWSTVNTTRRPRDIIYALHNPLTERLTTKTSEMTDVAKRYHDTLQQINLPNLTDPQCTEAQQRVLSEITPNQTLHDPNSPLHSLLTEDQVLRVLWDSKNGTATGLDGIPYELWKSLHDLHVQNTKANKPSFDVIKCLTLLYNDIQTHGTDPTTNFSAGWMCPIYKKKDKTRIENYRPITLLNTDYKVMTKALMTQLAAHACDLLHPNQTGFVPTRSIFDPIRLAESTCAYADYMEENGTIVALDQEKAYDKIDHHYLIATLKTFHLPDLFVTTIKSLYSHATTSIAINGVLSEPYRVIQGVRQGDPLSCLLFNLAIEPLAASIRNSTDLKGFMIPGTTTNVHVNLYADDTTVYLSESDKYKTLQTILARWCRASGAKFNVEKTEIIPIGTPEHRDRVISTQKLHPEEPPLQDNIRIAHDGTAVRCLGAWIGNGIDGSQPWNLVLDKIKNALDQWSKSKPTLDAKRLIIQMTIGSMTQFLTKAQGMPKSVLNALTKMTRDFIWDGKKSPPLSLLRLQQPRYEGGIDLLNIEARNFAIELSWLRDYLDTSKVRPTWSFITDAIINCVKPDGIQSTRDMNIFLTSVRPPTQTQNNTNKKQTPTRVIALLTAKRAKLSLIPLKISQDLQKQLPAWFHIGVPPKAYHRGRMACLRKNHQATNIGHLLKIAKHTSSHDHPHKPRSNCACEDCLADRQLGCPNPHRCASLARNIIGNLEPKFC